MKVHRPSPISPRHVRLTERDLAALDGELRCNTPTARRGWEIARLVLDALLRCRRVVCVVVLWAVSAGAVPPVGDVTLSWEPTLPLSTNTIFVLRTSPTLTTNLAAWPVLTNISGTVTTVTVRIVPGAQFFVMQSSNLWGLSDFSNVAATPPLPLSPLLSITGAR